MTTLEVFWNGTLDKAGQCPRLTSFEGGSQLGLMIKEVDWSRQEEDGGRSFCPEVPSQERGPMAEQIYKELKVRQPKTWEEISVKTINNLIRRLPHQNVHSLQEQFRLSDDTIRWVKGKVEKILHATSHED